MKKPERNDLNRGNKRNLRNMSGNRRGWFNCAGYALNTFSWYCPDAKHTKSGKDRAQKLLDDFPDLRIIKTVEELLPDEYAIAFRTSKTDFHFIKRCDNGQWRHKRGRSYDIEYMSTKEVFSARWCESRPDPYDGTIWLFAKKKPLPAARRHLDVIRLEVLLALVMKLCYNRVSEQRRYYNDFSLLENMALWARGQSTSGFPFSYGTPTNEKSRSCAN